MVTKAAVNGNATNGDTTSRSFSSSASDLARDVGELLELEGKLLLADIQSAKKRFISGVVMAVGAIVIALAALPLFLASIAWALVEFAQWSAAGAFALVSLVAIAGAAATIYFAWKKIADCGNAFSRSKTEWAANIRCIGNAARNIFHARMSR
jgi:uncharacterized membrane protein YqjE